MSEEDILVFVPPEERLLPDGSEVMLKYMTKERGDIWTFHRNDKDSFPSVVHGHNYETGEVIDALSGAIYNNNRVVVRQYRQKQLSRIQSDLHEHGFKL